MVVFKTGGNQMRLLAGLVAFIAAALGIYVESRSLGGREFLFGLNALGFSMIVVAAIGFVIGCILAVIQQRDEKRIGKRLGMIANTLDDIRATIENGEPATRLGVAARELSAIGAALRKSRWDEAIRENAQIDFEFVRNKAIQITKLANEIVARATTAHDTVRPPHGDVTEPPA
jgi:hypothetical protein